MKRSLADILVENSKVTKKVDGELSNPKVDNIHTPDNHTDGKKSRTVDGKRGLGDRKTKSVAQVQPPKKSERRSMKEEGAGKAGPASLTNTKANQKNRDEGVAKRSKKYHAKTKDGVREGLGDNPDSKASMPFSKASNKDEGLKKPKVAKGKGVARGARVGTIGDAKKNPANIGKTRKMDKSYIGGVPAPVAKVKESLDDMAAFLGTTLEVNSDLVENYPDDFSWSRFDAHYGTEDDDAAYDTAMDNMKDDVEAFLDKEGAGYIADYKQYVNDPRAKDDPSWFDEHLSGLVDAAYEIAIDSVYTEGYDFEVDEVTLKPMLVNFMKGAGVAEEHIPMAFVNYMSDENVSEFDDVDHEADEALQNTMSDAKNVMSHHGYNVVGGGLTGGRLNFRGQGGMASVDVHTFRPEEVISWSVKTNDGRQQEGRSIQDLHAFLSSSGPSPEEQKKPGFFKRMKNKVMGEMSSGGAVGSGAIASGPAQGRKGSLFAGEMDEAHGTSHAYLDWSKKIDGATKEEHLYDMSVEFKKDRRLTHDEIDELDAAMHRKARSLIGQSPRGNVANTITTEDDDPCWDSHKQVGMKKKGGREVPNCVPKKTNESRYGRWSRK